MIRISLVSAISPAGSPRHSARFFSPELSAVLREDAATRLTEQLRLLSHWHPFNRAQYLEAKTLLGNYLLCSQGDRMLMANSVEGRFPFGSSGH